MAYFPGNIMIIDDQFDLIYNAVPSETEFQIQYNSLLGIRKFSEDNGIPLIAISDTQDVESLKKKMVAYRNVRLLIIDLDLNNDGSVNEEDDYLLIYLILETAIEQYGYFLLMINSAHSEAWESIKSKMPGTINSKLIDNLTHVYSKSDETAAYKSIDLIGKNFSAELIYHFECTLNMARDKAFSNFLDFEKDSWKKIYLSFKKETGLMAHNDISNILLGILKQHFIDTTYPDIDDEGFDHDSDLRKLIYKTINYTDNQKGILTKQPIWTGNLYYINTNSEDRKYALIITPECDIAQNKHIYYKAIYGFEINDVTFPESYENNNITQDQKPPLYPFRVGKIQNNGRLDWGTKRALKNKVAEYKSFNQYLFPLPYITENLVYLDFRDIDSVSREDIVLKWKLLLRINEPMITHITDSYSNLVNRKGLLPI
ncbi:hypothetical protein QNI16_24010 [Cytophagaceae bacterium YF14B1]|uniref:Response receiver domain-containing protein n=1 Tax=Xanthocytophaga flava TaxID=3048013 RepID=A0AAE3QQM9_9BACT|nr:hypothetical protein [Xanthocytophaga flavus]MDJ1483585.1 hypothetical protein [Xanthocytophaga flavus]